MFDVLGLDLPTFLSLLSFGLIFFFIFYGPRIQSYATLGNIVKSMAKLEAMKGTATKTVVDYVKETGKADGDYAKRIDSIINYVTIMPVDMDPTGIVTKVEHLANTSDERARREISRLMKGADSLSLSVAQNLVEIAGGLNMMHKVVRHYYLTGRKMHSYATLMQLQMALPQILVQAQELVRAADSIKLGQPIGDGVGPMVASKFIGDAPKESIARDTVMAKTTLKGRQLYIVKAEGPMGYVGQPGHAIQRIVEQPNTSLKAIIMVDAAAKLEGEDTGDVSEGMGAAIGGIGVEKFQIEEVAAKHDIPVYAVLIKEGDEDVMSTMKKEIVDGAAKAVDVVARIIEENSNEGDTVLLAGIGNTLGVGQ
jgi:hypothetical protein